MNAQITSPNWNAIFSGALGIVAVLFVSTYLLGWKAALITTDRVAFFTLAALGFGMCILGMGQFVTRLGWAHPVTLAGTVLGVLILLLAVAVWAGWRVPLIPNDRAALIAVAVMGLVKWGLAIASRVWLLKG